MTDLHHLTDEELVTAIAALNGAERTATASLVGHLAELEARDLHVAMGFKSLYRYCRAVLHLSEYESYNRMEAAHAVRRFPVIVPMLADGLLHLTAVRLLAPYLGDENHLSLLGGAIHKSKVEVKELLARWFPKANVATSIRRVGASPQPAPAEERAGSDRVFAMTAEPVGREETTVADETTDHDARDSAAPAAKADHPTTPMPVTPPPRRATIDPLSAEAYSVRFTARPATIERLRRAQEILSHAVPDGNLDEILYRALGALIEVEARKKLAATRPRPEPRRLPRPARLASGTANRASRTVPAGVEREVRARDGDQCAFLARDGRRCDERRFLELHHLKPWVTGGGATAGNISLRCRAHNQYEWKVYVAPVQAAREEMGTRSGTS